MPASTENIRRSKIVMYQQISVIQTSLENCSITLIFGTIVYNRLIKHLIKTKFQQKKKKMLPSAFFEKIITFKHVLIISSTFDGFLIVTATVSFLTWMEVKTSSIYFSIIKKSKWKHVLLKSALTLRYCFLTFLCICSICLTILNLFLTLLKWLFQYFLI